MLNKGVFQVLIHGSKYRIFYIEKGVVVKIFTDEFNSYDEANSYLKTNKEQLDKDITDLKLAKQKEEEKALEEQKRKEEEDRKIKEAKELEEKRKKESIAKKKEERKAKRAERKNKVKVFFGKGWVKFVSGALIATMLLTGGHFIGKGISNSLKNKNSNKPSTSQGTNENVPNVNVDIKQDMESTITYNEIYSTENIEKVVTEFVKPYVSNNLSITTEDLLKFASIVNIDRLVEENPEFARELFSTQSAEEYLNDAAKVIGVTYMHNHNIWENDNNTDKFMWISTSIPDEDPQKEKMLELEGYVTKIANAVKEENVEEVNKITYELIESLTMPDGSLNAMDDGVEFGAQLYFALINNSIARNYLKLEYRDYFNTRASAEQNVSNIFAVYNGCINSDIKTRTRSN